MLSALHVEVAHRYFRRFHRLEIALAMMVAMLMEEVLREFLE
jgi:hypothetical protein